MSRLFSDKTNFWFPINVFFIFFLIILKNQHLNIFFFLRTIILWVKLLASISKNKVDKNQPMGNTNRSMC